MRKELMILALFGFTAFSSVVQADCGSRASTGSSCGSPRCAEPSSYGCNCSDPYCFSSRGGCISQAECCRAFGNVGGYKYDEDDTTPHSADDYSFNDETVYKGTVYGDYKGENG